MTTDYDLLVYVVAALLSVIVAALFVWGLFIIDHMGRKNR